MRATEMLFYRRLSSPLHSTRAGVGALWAAAPALAALLLYHPLALVALTVAILGAGAGAGVGRELVRALRTSLIVALPIVAINVLVSRQGLTVFARLGDLGPFGQGRLTLEALVYGAVIALKVTILILISTLASLAVDPDELLRIFRRFSFRSALTASLSTRMVPVLAADAARLAEAQATRPDGAPGGARGRIALLGAVIGGSLDRAMDVAATLELRGFATGSTRRGRGAHRPRAWSRHDLAFLGSTLVVVALALSARLAGMASFEAYPAVRAPTGLATLLVCLVLPAAILAPFADRKGIDP